MSVKKNLKTLTFKHGEVKIDPSEEYDAIYKVYFPPSDEFEASIENLLKAKFDTIKMSIRPTYVTSEEIEEIKSRLRNVEKKIEQISAFSQIEMEAAITYAYSLLKKIGFIKEIRNLSENKNLTFLVIIEDFSAELFKKIAEVEITLSRKFPSFNVEINTSVKSDSI